MKKPKNSFFKNMRYFCLVGVIALGLITIVGSNGGGGETATDGTNGGNGTATVSSITVSPASASITVGATQQFTATAKDASGNVIANVTFSWSSSNEGVATIDANGLATGVGQGTTEITASADAVTSTAATLTVTTQAAGLSPLVITSQEPTGAETGTSYTFTFTASGGTTPYTWDAVMIAPGSQTNGLSMDQQTGVMSGTPIFNGTMPLLVRVFDANSRNTSVQYDFIVGGEGSIRSITNEPPDGIQGSPYYFEFSTDWSGILGCSPNLSYINGHLPPGLGLNYLGGWMGDASNWGSPATPLTAGTYTFTLWASTNEFCMPAPLETNAQTFTVYIAPSASPSSPPGASNSLKEALPVLSPSSAGWDADGISSPSVIKAGESYLMYYEGVDPDTYKRQIGLATSADGKDWTKSSSNPVLEAGPSGSWDALEVRCPTVHFDGITYRMWYLGRDSIDAAREVGFATSTDGITWSKHADPVFGEYGTVIPGTVIQDGGQFLMWYGTTFNFIGRATSPDGIAWTDDGEVLDPSFAKGGRPSVVLDGATYRMWFSKATELGGGITSGPSVNQTSIGFASSVDGISWTAYEDTDGNIIPVLAMGPEFSWDRPGVGQPSVIKYGTTFKMWYTGGRIMESTSYPNVGIFVEGSIGYAAIP